MVLCIFAYFGGKFCGVNDFILFMVLYQWFFMGLGVSLKRKTWWNSNPSQETT